MENNSLKNIDNLILGIGEILSKHRCSFSDEEQVLLRDCINMLEQSKSEPDQLKWLSTSVKVMGTLARIFSIYNHLKDLF
ncbi:hypothetical protein [Pedobacter jeongneungensis]